MMRVCVDMHVATPNTANGQRRHGVKVNANGRGLSNVLECTLS